MFSKEVVKLRLLPAGGIAAVLLRRHAGKNTVRRERCIVLTAERSEACADRRHEIRVRDGPEPEERAVMFDRQR